MERVYSYNPGAHTGHYHTCGTCAATRLTDNDTHLTAAFQDKLVPDSLGSRFLLELRMLEVVLTAEARRPPKLQSNHHHQQKQHPTFLQAGCPSRHPTNSIRALTEKWLSGKAAPIG